MLTTALSLAALVAFGIVVFMNKRLNKQHEMQLAQSKAAIHQRLARIDTMRNQIVALQATLQATQDQLRAANAKLNLSNMLDAQSVTRRARPEAEVVFPDTEPMNEWKATQPYVPARPAPIEGIIGSYA